MLYINSDAIHIRLFINCDTEFRLWCDMSAMVCLIKGSHLVLQIKGSYRAFLIKGSYRAFLIKAAIVPS